EPRNLRALLMKGDHLVATDKPAATHFYAAAFRAAPPRERLPADLAAHLDRAGTFMQRYSHERETFLRERLAAPGVRDGKSRPRFSSSFDLLAGRKRLYLREPRYYYFPGLPQIQFYDNARFPWLEQIEAATADIREELLGVLPGDDFKPYVEGGG